MKKHKQNSYESLTMQDLIRATPLLETPDRTSVKWPNVKKWYRPRQLTTTRPTKQYRPSPTFYWSLLREANRFLDKCELCGSYFRITIHHKDGNCFNNSLDNLAVLCWKCHKRNHSNFDDFGVQDEEEGTVNDF